MARTKHERIQQQTRERRTKAEEKEEKEEERLGEDELQAVRDEAAVKRIGERGAGGEDGGSPVKHSQSEKVTQDDDVSHVTTEEAVVVEERVEEPVDGRGGEVGELSEMESGGVERGEEEEGISAGKEELRDDRALGSGAPVLNTTESSCSEKCVSQAVIDSLLVQIESEISARMAQQKEEEEGGVSDSKTSAEPPKQQLCIHEEQLRRLKAELELAVRQAEMLAAENVEWKRASEKQQGFREEIQAVHVLRRTQATQLRRVVKTLETEGNAARDECGDALSALHEIANALYPCKATVGMKEAHHDKCDAMVFPAKPASSCTCERGSRHWPVKKEEGDFSGEYEFRVFRLTEEPLKKRCYTSLESLELKSSSCKINEDSDSRQIARILEEYETKSPGRYVFEPPKLKRRRIRTQPSSDSNTVSEDEGELSDTSLEVALSTVDPKTPVHPGSEDAFLMIAL